jgi:hypothetical protein
VQLQIASMTREQRRRISPATPCDVLRRGDYKLCQLEREPGDRILLVVPTPKGPSRADVWSTSWRFKPS